MPALHSHPCHRAYFACDDTDRGCASRAPRQLSFRIRAHAYAGAIGRHAYHASAARELDLHAADAAPGRGDASTFLGPPFEHRWESVIACGAR